MIDRITLLLYVSIALQIGIVVSLRKMYQLEDQIERLEERILGKKKRK